METEALDLAKEGVSFLISANDEEKLESSDIIASLEKLSKDVKDFIELRADIFLQKEEKIQQYQQDQLRKLENEEQYYVEKYKGIEINLSDYKKQLKEVENTIVTMKEKLASVEDLNEKLKYEMSNLTTEKDDLKVKHHKKHSLYLMVIQWYEDFLKINIDIHKENPKVLTFYFSNENSELAPYIKFEVTDDFKFKILDTHVDLEGDKKNFQEMYTVREVISFIYESQEKLRRKN